MKRMVCVALSLIMASAILLMSVAPAQSWTWCRYYGPSAYPETIDSLEDFLTNPVYFNEDMQLVKPFDTKLRGAWYYTAIATEAGNRNYLQEGEDNSFYTVFSTDDVRGCYYTEWGAWQYIDLDESELRLKDKWAGQSTLLNTPDQYDDHLLLYRLLNPTDLLYDDTRWNLDLFLPAGTVIVGFNDFGGDGDYDDLIFALMPDTDKDGWPNHEDKCPTVSDEGNDQDGDAVGDVCDNCLDKSNPAQLDSEFGGAECAPTLQHDLFGGTGIARLDDNIIDSEEWADAKRFYLDIDLGSSAAEPIPAILYVMNDARFVHVGLHIESDAIEPDSIEIQVAGQNVNEIEEFPLAFSTSAFSVYADTHMESSYLFDGKEANNEVLLKCGAKLFIDVFLADTLIFSSSDPDISDVLTLQPAGDGIGDTCDNCPDQLNGNGLGTCSITTTEGEYVACSDDSQCPDGLGYCSMIQENFDVLSETSEMALGDACDLDDDGDGMPDMWEVTYGLNPYFDDSEGDLDGDGLNNLGEYLNGTDPIDVDTEDDGMWDGWEVKYQLLPLFNDANQDPDLDKWTNLQEFQSLSEKNPRSDTSKPGADDFSEGLRVSPSGDDNHLGNIHHPVRTLHVAAVRLNLLDKGTFDVHIEALPNGVTYDVSYEGDDTPLIFSKHTALKLNGVGDVVIDGTASGSWSTGIVLSSGLSVVTLEGINFQFFNIGIEVGDSDIELNLINVEIKNSIQSGIDIGSNDNLLIDMTTSTVSDCINGLVFGVGSSNVNLTGGQVLRSSETGVIISGSSSTINGLQVLNGNGTGILIEGSENEVASVKSSNNKNGVVVAATALDTTITNIEVSNNTAKGLILSGDRSDAGSTNEVDGASIFENETGILIQGSNYVVTGGSASTNGNGIVVAESAQDNAISSIEIHNNTINGLVINGDNTSVNSADLLGNVQNGIAISAAQGVEITDSNIAGPATVEEGGTGISIGMGTEDIVLSGTPTGMTIKDYDTGIKVTVDAACINLSDVQITSCRTGMKLVETMQAKIDMGEYEAQSEIYSCDTGIAVSGNSSNNIIKNGIVKENIAGIVNDGFPGVPDGNIFESMKVIDNLATGIKLLAGFDHRIVNSIITGNGADDLGSSFGGIAIVDSTVVLRWNEIHSNYCWDIYVDDALAGSPIDARFNWWGDEAGPTGKVGEYLFYEPVLPYRDEWIGLPLQDDFDEDGLGDQWEVANGLDPYDLENPDGEALFDDTGLTNRQAYQLDPLSNGGYPDAALYVGFGEGDDLNAGSPRFPLETVTTAVEKVNAMDVDSSGAYPVYLSSGVYNFDAFEPTTIDENITLIGYGSDQTIIEGPGIRPDNDHNLSAIFQVSPGPSQVQLQGMTIRNTEVGVRVFSDGSCVNFSDIVMEDCGTGLQLLDSYQSQIDFGGSMVFNCKNGIEVLGGSSDNTVANAWLTDNIQDGIFVYGSNDVPEDNTFQTMQVLYNGRNGVSLFAGSGNTVNNSVISGNNLEPPAMLEEPWTVFGGVVMINGTGSVNWSAVEGNHCWGVYVEDSPADGNVNAKYNWWGDAGGPSGVGPGAGDAVSDYVTYEPWLSYLDPWIGEAAPEDLDDDGMGDAWESMYIVDDPNEDLDGDGITNLQEFQAFTNPRNPNDFPDNTTIFVGFEGGSDENVGSPRFPLSTLHGTLHGAIEKLNALKAGDYTVYVAPGTYMVGTGGEDDAPISIEQSVFIYGDDLVTLDGTGAQNWTSAFAVTHGAEHVRIEGIDIRNFKTGIQVVSDAACIELSGLHIWGCDQGILLTDSTQVLLDMGLSEISDCTTGVLLTTGNFNNTVSNGILRGNLEDGILVDGSCGPNEENHFIGMHILDNDGYGVLFSEGVDNRLADSHIIGNNLIGANEGGVAVKEGTAQLSYNIVADNMAAGIYLTNADNAVINNNLVYDSHDLQAEKQQINGLLLSGSSDVVVMSNTVADNKVDGLFIGENSSAKLLYNILYGNTLDLNVEDEYFNIGFESLEYNTIGATNLPWLPPSNIPLDPQLDADYKPTTTSPSIDATRLTAVGRDLVGNSRPIGQYWDMGAYESPNFVDVDQDGMPDWWEELYLTNGLASEPLADDDDDGISNIEEYRLGTDPDNPLSLAVTGFTVEDDEKIVESSGSYYTNASSIDIDLAVSAAVTHVNGEGATTGLTGVNLVGGDNQILITGDDDNALGETPETGEDPVTLILNVRKDSSAPSISIVSPTSQGTYTTALSSIVISGTVIDDTLLDETQPIVCEAGGTSVDVVLDGSTWQTSPIALAAESTTIITVTAVDIFGFSSALQAISILKESGIEEQTVLAGSQQDNPLDPDQDGVVSEDELSCGTDPNDPGSVPVSQLENTYPIDSAEPNYDPGKIYMDGNELKGYTLPDCLNPDDDGDGMPDWWEIEYGDNNPDCTDHCLNPYDNTDFDENPDGDKNEVNGEYTNIEEYRNGTNPFVPQTIKFVVSIHDKDTGDDITASWLPTYDEAVIVQATWIDDPDDQDDTPPATVMFSLKETSRYLGRAVNDPDPVSMTAHNYPSWYEYDGYDFGLVRTDDAQGHSFEQDLDNVTPEEGQVFYTAYLQSWDFGGRTKVLVANTDAPDQIGIMWVPRGSGSNGIGDAWVHDAGDTLVPNADMDRLVFDKTVYSAPLGDDFTNFEEYRGIVYTEPDINGLHELKHERLNPYRKDLFVRGIGFSENYPFDYGDALKNAGIDDHDVTGWGHDATADGLFYTYYTAGKITDIASKTVTADVDAAWQTTWPKHEWEFRLDTDSGDDDAWTPIGKWKGAGLIELDIPYQGVASSQAGGVSYSIRRPLPHINVLLVRHDDQRDSLFPWDDGHIKFVSASQPSNQNPLGTRNWTWSTKGYSITVGVQEQEDMYGIAFTLQNPLDRYFYDRPYEQVTAWDGSGWVEASARDLEILSPLSESEDYTDSGSPVDGYTAPNIGVLPNNVPNGIWDGDRRILNSDEWPLDPTKGGSPFNIDGDDFVELPFASSPEGTMNDTLEEDKFGNKYTIEHVLKHTITHEMIHALAGPSHTSDPDCLMYKYSNNWKRDDYLSDYYRSLLRVHNKLRW